MNALMSTSHTDWPRVNYVKPQGEGKMTIYYKAQDNRNEDSGKPRRINLNMNAITLSSLGKDNICLGCHVTRSNLNIDEFGGSQFNLHSCP